MSKLLHSSVKLAQDSMDCRRYESDVSNITNFYNLVNQYNGVGYIHFKQLKINDVTLDAHYLFIHSYINEGMQSTILFSYWGTTTYNIQWSNGTPTAIQLHS